MLCYVTSIVFYRYVCPSSESQNNKFKLKELFVGYGQNFYSKH